MTPAELLNIAAWAAQLSAAELEHAARGVVIRSFSRGAYICHRGDRLDYWTGVITGICKISTVSPQGKAISYSGVPAGGWFGEGSIIKNEPRKYDIVAVRDSEVAFMTGGTFRWLFENSTGFNRFLVMQLNERLGQFIGMVGYDRDAGRQRPAGAHDRVAVQPGAVSRHPRGTRDRPAGTRRTVRIGRARRPTRRCRPCARRG